MTTPRHFLGIVKTAGQTTITPTLSGHEKEEVEGRQSSSLSCDRHLAVEQSAPDWGIAHFEPRPIGNRFPLLSFFFWL